MVAGEGIAPPTQGFSDPCSTTELPSRVAARRKGFAGRCQNHSIRILVREGVVDPDGTRGAACRRQPSKRWVRERGIPCPERSSLRMVRKIGLLFSSGRMRGISTAGRRRSPSAEGSEDPLRGLRQARSCCQVASQGIYG